MSLFGALFSGVSGLQSQSSAMGAISDNITNVSTTGYKNTNVNFKTLITAQTSSTQYSPGDDINRTRRIGSPAARNRGPGFAGVGIVAGKVFTTGSFDPFAANEHAVALQGVVVHKLLFYLLFLCICAE